MLILSSVFEVSTVKDDPYSLLADVFSYPDEPAHQDQRCMMKFRLQSAARGPQGTND